jgi:hypothetical protein
LVELLWLKFEQNIEPFSLLRAIMKKTSDLEASDKDDDSASLVNHALQASDSTCQRRTHK